MSLARTQQGNFLEVLQRMSTVPGWEILQSDRVMALKAPGEIPFVNMAWGIPSVESIKAVRQFYTGRPYCWLAEGHPSGLEDYGFLAATEFPEMLLSLDTYPSLTYSSKITVEEVSSDSQLQVWSATAVDSFGFDITCFRDFFYPIIRVAGCQPFLACYEGVPAATALIYNGQFEVGVYTMSTRVEFRRKGLASAVLAAALEVAKANGARCAVLYATEMGEPLYDRLGFAVTNLFNEFSFVGSKPRGN
ncbi:GNAT family N-acetyltransferase [Pseudomonas akapageensis]|uniref:GNAT family N-acetyltransferase n=1 Tax=Pseudomonas akapageensis TaxID=2609961 RepID=UPI0014091593|nr:GNAT family N-acetyltransferase [Pseudomonas akapageensis]